MKRLILSLFPGIGLLDAQFESEGFCVVRGPDLLWGGDVASFHPPAGVFAGVIGGPPCQDFSSARRSPPTGDGVRCLEQFARIVAEARPVWWLAENVPRVPDLIVDGYDVQRIDVELAWFSNVRRSRVIQFGRLTEENSSAHNSAIEDSQPLDIPRGTVSPDAEPAALASDERTFSELCRLQGLPSDFKLPGFTDAERKRAVGNGVPALLGRVLARAVLRSVYHESGSGEPDPTFDSPKRCEICQRRISGRRLTCSDACRYHKSQRSRRPHASVAGPAQFTPTTEAAHLATSGDSVPVSSPTGVRVGGSMVAPAFVVQLERGCWLAPIHGDPGRTMVASNATRFVSRRDAEGSLQAARKYRPFPDASVVELTGSDCCQ